MTKVMAISKPWLSRTSAPRHDISSSRMLSIHNKIINGWDWIPLLGRYRHLPSRVYVGILSRQDSYPVVISISQWPSLCMCLVLSIHGHGTYEVLHCWWFCRVRIFIWARCFVQSCPGHLKVALAGRKTVTPFLVLFLLLSHIWNQ
jgi:hypothetical protein